MSLSEDLNALANAFANAEIIMLHSGDREPGHKVSNLGKQWVIDALRFHAQMQAIPETARNAAEQVTRDARVDPEVLRRPCDI